MTDIHDLFHANDGQAPSTEGWADKVRSRHRRRRAGAGVAAGVLTVALAVPIGASLLRPPVQLASPTETKPPALAPRSADEVCADAADQVAKRDPARLTGDGVIDGAARVWLCGDTPFGGPIEPLTVGVDEATRAFLGSPMAPKDQICTGEYRMVYTAVFEYPDATMVPVTGELHGCRGLSDGASSRSGSEEFLTTLKELWTAQRAAVGEDITTLPRCSNQMRSILPFDPSSVIGLQVCSLDGETWRTGDLPAGAANGELARSIVAAVTDEAAGSGDPTVEYAIPQVRIQLFDRFGGLLSLDRLSDGRFLTFSDTKMRFWTPQPDVLVALGLDS